MIPPVFRLSHATAVYPTDTTAESPAFYRGDVTVERCRCIIVLVERVCASIDGCGGRVGNIKLSVGSGDTAKGGGVGGDVGVSSGASNSFTSGNVLMHTPDGGVGANSTAASSGLIKLTTGWARRAAQVTCLTAGAKVARRLRKILVIRCRKPVSSVFELLLSPSLVFIANLDSIFGTGGNYSSSSEAATGTIMYTGLDSPAYTDYGALSTNMPTFYSSGQSVRQFLLISYIKFVSTTTTATMFEKNRRPNSSSTKGLALA
ncbi:hypothetical protein PHYSODRAFT_324497 [Phytophthora sojae]|uniref:Uncharacterized protein n=1 Tax=Phytophthora sojae (strain P6497) TaxID=1094619 RepID=G4YYC0_PHYSP|nr:hypothetical protein PHYSODRAFT_324497 [Phytophthora sojae]EGZ23271.1 hypothetical protein PHYSODRAFT_324497 [Phytophthora sojae]|eukprot:XP_009518559.1 hypothetical protein PHYSODRAFT_324497 [Phytophthora sojae]